MQKSSVESSSLKGGALRTIRPKVQKENVLPVRRFVQPIMKRTIPSNRPQQQSVVTQRQPPVAQKQSVQPRISSLQRSKKSVITDEFEPSNDNLARILAAETSHDVAPTAPAQVRRLTSFFRSDTLSALPLEQRRASLFGGAAREVRTRVTDTTTNKSAAQLRTKLPISRPTFTMTRNVTALKAPSNSSTKIPMTKMSETRNISSRFPVGATQSLLKQDPQMQELEAIMKAELDLRKQIADLELNKRL